MSSKQTYVLDGVVRVGKTNVNIDNFTTEAYSDKQARLKLAFALRTRLGNRDTITDLYSAITRSRLSISRR